MTDNLYFDDEENSFSAWSPDLGSQGLNDFSVIGGRTYNFSANDLLGLDAGGYLGKSLLLDDDRGRTSVSSYDDYFTRKSPIFDNTDRPGSPSGPSGPSTPRGPSGDPYLAAQRANIQHALHAESAHASQLASANGLNDPSLGMNLSEIADWTPELGFLNVAKLSREWSGYKLNNGWDNSATAAFEPYMDENGWPTEIPEGYRSMNILFYGHVPTGAHELVAGRHVLQYEGEGTIRLSAHPNNVRIISQEPGKIVFDFIPNNDGVHLMIESTDPNHNGEYIRNISVVKEEYLDLYEAGEMFHPVFLEMMQDFRELRFMQWGDGEDNTPNPEIHPFNRYTYGASVPPEVMIELCNQAGTDGWFTIPFYASDEYIREFAQIIKDNLDPRLTAHIEYGNELWNWGYAIARDNMNIARADPNFMQYGESAHIYGYGYRAAHVMDIFNQVFSDEPDRIDTVIAWQQSSGDYSYSRILAGMERYLLDNPDAGDAVQDLLDSWSITWYFGQELMNVTDIETIKQWRIDYGDAGAADRLLEHIEHGGLLSFRNGISLVQQTINYLTYTIGWAHAHGLEFSTYEGGIHFAVPQAYRNDTDFRAFLDTIIYDPRMDALYKQIYDAFVAAGGEVLQTFNAIQATGSAFGDFGHANYLGDTDNPHWQSVVDMNAIDNPNLDPNDAYQQGSILFGTEDTDTLVGTREEDFLIGGGGNDSIFGGAGDDGLHGGAGDDVIYAGTGDDRVIGGSGNDSLYGGLGNDTFVLNAVGDGVDMIFDFSIQGDTDVLDIGDAITGYHAGDDLHDFIRLVVNNSNPNQMDVQISANGDGNFTTVAILDHPPITLTTDQLINNHVAAIA